MSVRPHLIVLLKLCFAAVAVGQHTVDFQLPAQACIGEKIVVNNMSDPGVQTEWNFCASQLEGTHTPEPFKSIGVLISGIALAEENGLWYGFLTSENSQLVRLEFGEDPGSSDYAITMLGNFDNLMVAPKGIDMVRENGTWYGLATTHDGEIVRLAWSNSLADLPEVENLNLAATGKLNGPRAIEISKDGDDYIAVVANSLNNKVLLVNFGNTITNNPVDADIIESPILPGAGNTTGVTVSRQCQNWYIYAIADNKIYRIDIGTTLYASITLPMVTEFSADIPIALSTFNKIEAVDYNGDTYLYIVSFSGGYFAQLIWKNGATSVVYNDLGNPVVPGNPFAIGSYKYQGHVGLYVGGFNSGVLGRIAIEGPCHASTQFSSVAEPEGVFFDEAGTYVVSLTTHFADGSACVAISEIEITSDVAPVPVISTEGICAGADVLFEGSEGNEVAINTYSWDFGDTQIGNGQAQTHTYSNEGTFSVHLEATGANGCVNFADEVLQIYDPPVAQFTLPSGTLCTNNVLEFENTTVDHHDGFLTFEWEVDGTTVSAAQDLQFAFTSTGNHTVKLTAAIPGCSSEESHTLTGVASGPAVSFTMSGKCEDEAVEFVSDVTGDASEYLWDFGNGTTSDQVHAEEVFVPGDYNVSLEVLATNGCLTSVSEPLVIYSKPLPNFSLDLPPFSCVGTPSQFHDLTPTPDDSNLQSWHWKFGDQAMTNMQNPVHTYLQARDYNVELTVTTDRGCAATISKSVTISNSPDAAISNNPVCANQATNFAGASQSTISAWQWKIGTANYTQQNPTHSFAAPGDYSVELTVTAPNNCRTTVARSVTVPQITSSNIVVQNACAGNEATLFGNFASSNDDVSTYSWNFGDGQTGEGYSPVHTFAEAKTYDVQLTALMESGCVYSVSSDVIIHPIPTTAFTPGEVYGPAPVTTTFQNLSTGATSYLWSFAALMPSSTEVSPTTTFSTLGTYNVVLEATSAEGCTGTASGVVHVIVPHADLSLQQFTLGSDPGTNQTRGILVVKNNGNYPVTSVDLAIDMGAGIVITENLPGSIAPGAQTTLVTNSSLTFQSGGSGFICITTNVPNDENPGDNRQCITLDAATRLFEAYPNPSDGALSMEVVSTIPDVLQIQIMNTTGAVAYSKDVDVSIGLNVYDLDLSMLSPGIYFIRAFTSSSEVLSQRIVIHR